MNQIRADYDARTIVVYQAYSPAIAEPAVAARRFVPPFSLGRMTWIKPSFLWLMERSNWAQKAGQERVLAVRITRAGFEEALAAGVLTAFTRGVHRDVEDWERQFAAAACASRLPVPEQAGSLQVAQILLSGGFAPRV